MIQVNKYNSDNYGFRRCHVCGDVTSKDETLTEMVLGGMQIIMCNSCLEKLKDKISDRLRISESEKLGKRIQSSKNIYSDLTDEEMEQLNLEMECTNPND